MIHMVREALIAAPPPQLLDAVTQHLIDLAALHLPSFDARDDHRRGLPDARRSHEGGSSVGSRSLLCFHVRSEVEEDDSAGCSPPPAQTAQTPSVHTISAGRPLADVRILCALQPQLQQGYADWVDSLPPTLAEAANAYLHDGPTERATTLHELMDGVAGAPAFRAAVAARRTLADTAPPAPAAPLAGRRDEDGPAQDTHTALSQADPTVLRRFTGTACTFYAQFISALPEASRAAVNSYLISLRAAASDIATAIANAQLAAADAGTQPAPAPPAAPTTPATPTHPTTPTTLGVEPQPSAHARASTPQQPTDAPTLAPPCSTPSAAAPYAPCPCAAQCNAGCCRTQHEAPHACQRHTAREQER
jgi:hypothetical protein